MSARIFLDTNVIAYAFDASAPEKQRRARELMAGRDWGVSWQVVQEFANVALHRFATPMKPNDLADFLDLVLWPHCVAVPTSALFRMAAALHAKTQFRFYDCLIVASALSWDAKLLLTEDLQDGRELGKLKIENPFR